MATLNIGGKRVKVDDAFLSMSPEEQNAAVEEIAGQIGATAAPESDAARSFREQASATTQAFGKDKLDGTMRADMNIRRGAADMLTMGMSDEISALLSSTFDAATGTPGNYDRRLFQERVRQKIQDQKDPIASTVGRIGGAVAGASALRNAPVFGMSAGATLPATMANSARSGAAFGGLYGFGSGEGMSDRFGDAAGGAVMGAAIGGAVPVIASGMRAAAKPFTDAIGARINPSKFADKKVAERLASSGLDADSVAAKMARTPGSAMADVAGKDARNLLRTTVNIPGPARDRVTKQVNIRQFGQGDRLKTAVARTFADPDGYLKAMDDLAAASKATAAPLYNKAYSMPVHFSETLEDILTTPAGKAALAKAQQLAANEQAPFKQIFININGQPKRVPDTRGWDYIKRAMDDMIDAQTDAMTRQMTNEGRILTSLKNRMLAEVDKFNPVYKQARSASATVMQLREALEFGRKSLSMSPHAVKRELAKMTPAQKEAARIGAAEEMRKAIDGAGIGHNAILKVFGSRQKIKNLEALFDNPRQFGEFRKTVFAEARKRATYDAVKGNSTTAQQLADMFEAGGTEATEFAGRAVTQGPVSATIQWIGSRLKRLGGLTPQVADHISKRLMTTDPAASRAMYAALKQIEAKQLSAAAKAQAVQAMVRNVLTSQSVGAFAQTN